MEKATMHGLVTDELSYLYEISSLSFSDSGEKVVEEAKEKAVRLFGVRYFALFTGQRDNRRLGASWGFRNEEDAWERMKQNEPNQIHFVFNEEFGELFIEHAHPIEERERCLLAKSSRKHWNKQQNK